MFCRLVCRSRLLFLRIVEPLWSFLTPIISSYVLLSSGKELITVTKCSLIISCSLLCSLSIFPHAFTCTTSCSTFFQSLTCFLHAFLLVLLDSFPFDMCPSQKTQDDYSFLRPSHVVQTLCLLTVHLPMATIDECFYHND